MRLLARARIASNHLLSAGPQGERGFASVIAQLQYRTVPTRELYQAVNGATMVIVQFESVEAVDRADEIFAVDGVDMALFGTNDAAIHVSLASAATANADDYRLEPVPGCGHFIADERPELVRSRLVDLAREVGAVEKPAGTPS